MRARWTHRRAPDPESPADVVRAMTFPPGEVHAFVHGEASTVRELRRHLLGERGVPQERLSISGHWRHGADDTFTQEKAAEPAD